LLILYSENLNWAAQNLRLGRMRPAVGHSWSRLLVKSWHCLLQRYMPVLCDSYCLAVFNQYPC